MNKIFQIIAWCTIIFALGLLILMGFWSFYPYKPIEYKSSTYKVLTKQVKPGGTLVYVVDYCKYSNQVPVITKKYVDGIIYDTPPGRGVVIQGCHQSEVYTLIPETLLPGDYYMQVNIDYQVNPIRHMIYNNVTEKFTVTNK